MTTANSGQRWRDARPVGTVPCLLTIALLLVMVLALLVSGLVMRLQIAAEDSFMKYRPTERVVDSRWQVYGWGKRSWLGVEIIVLGDTATVSSWWPDLLRNGLDEGPFVRVDRRQPAQ